MALTADEKKTLDALMAKDKEPEDSGDFEVEVTDENNRTVRMPYSKGKTFLKKWGFDLDDLPGGDGKPEGDGKPDDDGKPEGDGKPGYWQKK